MVGGRGCNPALRPCVQPQRAICDSRAELRSLIREGNCLTGADRSKRVSEWRRRENSSGASSLCVSSPGGLSCDKQRAKKKEPNACPILRPDGVVLGYAADHVCGEKSAISLLIGADRLERIYDSSATGAA